MVVRFVFRTAVQISADYEMAMGFRTVDVELTPDQEKALRAVMTERHVASTTPVGVEIRESHA